MDIITGEKIQSLCNHHISINEFQPYELQGVTYIDPYNFVSPVFANKGLVYINLDLIRGPIPEHDLSPESRETQVFKKELDLYDILSRFINPFYLVLHNNDYNFEEKDLVYLNIPNCKKIFTQNCLVNHPDVTPLPIGVANSCWPWGDLEAWKTIEPEQVKDHEIYFNFTIEGGCRDVKRPSCFNKFSKLGVPWIENKEYSTYLQDLNNYKFIVSPEGNGIDCHRTWEALYLKVIPIVDRNPVTEYYSMYFPMVLVEDWDTFNLDRLEGIYESADWSNYHLLYFTEYKKTFLNV